MKTALLKPWPQRPTGLNSTQLVELSPIGHCDYNPRLISTQPVQLSQVLLILNIGCVPRVITSPDAMWSLFKTQLNSTAMERRTGHLFSGTNLRSGFRRTVEPAGRVRQETSWWKRNSEWPLMGGLLHFVPNVTAHPSTSSVPITVLLYNDP